MKNKFKKHHYRIGRKRATSPIVATILLIGLTVLSGAILYEITMNYLNVQPKVGLSYQDPNVYQTSEKSFLFSTSKINSFDITVSNPNDQQMMINLAASNVYYSNGTRTRYWTANYNSSSYILLNGKETTSVTFSTSHNETFEVGQQYYVVFSVMRPDTTDPNTITTSTFTVTKSNFQPKFLFVPTLQTINQDNYNVTFIARPSENYSLEVTGVLWNLGNPDIAYTKSAQFFVENDTAFTIDSQYTNPNIKAVTIPSSSNIGYYDSNQPDLCVTGYACVNISIPIFKNVNTTQESYGAYLSITGLDLIPFQLNVKNPAVRITLRNTNRYTGGSFRFNFNNIKYCPSNPNLEGQIADTIVFFGSPSCMDTKTVKFDIWNLLSNASSANVEISGLNTTAFTLFTSVNGSKWSNYDDMPQNVSLTAGPGKTYKKWINYCFNPSTQACNRVTWGIARNPLVDNNGDPNGILAGDYPITVTDLTSGTQQQFDLYIQPYEIAVHVASMNGSVTTKGGKSTITFKVTVEDSVNHILKNIQVSAELSYVTGHKTKTDTLKPRITDSNGIATFYINDAKSGKNTILVTNLSVNSRTFGRWHKTSALILYWDSSLDNPNPPSIYINV